MLLASSIAPPSSLPTLDSMDSVKLPTPAQRVTLDVPDGSDAYLRAPGESLVSNTFRAQSQFHQLRSQLTYGSPGKRGFSGAAAVGYDENLKVVQYGAFQATYNWICCGITAEYRRFSLGALRNENQYRFTFSLANIGSFGNLRRQERLY